MSEMNYDEDPALWLESYVNPHIPSPTVHPAYEDAAQAAHAARLQQRQQQAQMEQWRDKQREQDWQQQQQRQQQAQREQRNNQQREQHRQQQQQEQQFRQLYYPQLQAGQAFEENTLQSYDGTQLAAPYNFGQTVTTGEPGGHSVRPSNKDVRNPQYVRPSDIRQSFPNYLPNTSRQANVPFPASSRPPAGAMQAPRPMMTQQRTSQSVSESQYPRPSDYAAENPSSSTSNHARQECSPATPMPNGLSPIHQQYRGHQEQALASARPVNQYNPASTSANPKTDTDTSAARSSLGPQSTNLPESPNPVYRHLSQNPAAMAPALGSAVPGQTAQAPVTHVPPSPATPPGGISLDQNSKHDLNKQSSATHALPHSQAGIGNGTMAPNHQLQPPSRPSIAQGQQPPNKMRRVYDGSKNPNGPNTKKYMPRAKQASQKTPQWLDLVRPLDVNDMFLKDSYDVATIARDVLITAGKHPSEKPLNHHLHALMKTIPVLDHSSDLATLRWDGIDPLIYSRDKRPRNTSTRPPAQPINAIGAVVPLSSHGNSLPPQPSSLPSLPHNYHPTKSNPSIPPPPPIPSTPDPAPERAPSKPQAAAETPTTKLSSTPRSKFPPASPRAVPPAQSPRTKENFQPQVVISCSPEKMPPIKKKAGRPKKDAKSDNVAVTVSSPSESPMQFPVFKCLWEKCQTELHSLVLLQQHVLKAHIPYNITCGWKECDNSDPMPASALWEHLTDRHFKDYAWALGDGPAVPSPGEDDQDESPFVPQLDLFDRQARPATVLLPLDDYVVAGYSKSHGIKNSKQRAELFKDAGCRWKEEAGPDVDISDRRLSTPPRLVTSRLTEIAMTPSESP